MKQQVARFSPHQNGKVFAILMAVSSLVVFVPMMFVASMAGPKDAAAPPVLMLVLLPLGYLVFGYLSVVIGCALYNFMFRYIGGIEYEARSTDA